MSADRATAIHEIERLLHELTLARPAAFARQVSDYRLSALQYLALHEVGRLAPNVTMGDVGEAIQVPPSHDQHRRSSRRRQAVERGANPSDRRAVVVNLTPSGTI